VSSAVRKESLVAPKPDPTIPKQQPLDCIRHETEILKHLPTKVPEGGHDYRSTPGQRSTHAKAAGNHDLGSANCWAGVDRVET